MKKHINVAFYRLWKSFDITDFSNLFSYLLSDFSFHETSINDADIIFHSTMSGNRKIMSTFKKPNIFFMIETWVPNNIYDAQHIIHTRTDLDNVFNMPAYWAAMYITGHKINEFLDRKIHKKTKFCNFIYKVSKKQSRQYDVRIKFFKEMYAKYGFIHAPGKSMNNCPSIDVSTGKYARHYDKLNFLKDFNYTLAFENMKIPGYVTEKFSDPILAGSVPIYWGAPDILTKYKFNKNAFILIENPSQDINKIKNISYDALINEPIFLDNKIPYIASEERVYNFMYKILKEV